MPVFEDIEQPRKMHCITIIITLEGIEKIIADTIITKQSKKSHRRASGLKYSLALPKSPF